MLVSLVPQGNVVPAIFLQHPLPIFGWAVCACKRGGLRNVGYECLSRGARGIIPHHTTANREGKTKRRGEGNTRRPQPTCRGIQQPAVANNEYAAARRGMNQVGKVEECGFYLPHCLNLARERRINHHIAGWDAVVGIPHPKMSYSTSIHAYTSSRCLPSSPETMILLAIHDMGKPDRATVHHPAR